MSKAMVLTSNEKEFISNYRKHGGDIEKVCSIMGMSHSAANRLLNKKPVREELNRSLFLARQKIEQATPYLVDKCLEMINDSDINEKVKAQLLNSLLDRSGIVAPKNTNIQVNINTEIADRAREIMAQTIDITPE